jgi:predicted ArsR family transcriptional regulator
VERPDVERHPIAAVALLSERGRRDLYDFVRRSSGPVTRDEAAAHTGISRGLAAFHLDKLVHGGLLRAHTDRPAAGVGRRPKVYEPQPVELAVSVPARQYDLLAELLLDAVAATSSRGGGGGGTAGGGGAVGSAGSAGSAGSGDSGGSVDRPAGDLVAGAARDQARERGRAAGAEARGRARPGRLGAERALTLAQSVLEGAGYEPDRASPRHLVLRNCPFARLAERSRELVCGINHAFCSGVVAGLDAGSVDARLDPLDGGCCVQLHGR